jgi:serine/threonine protein kinase
MNAPLNREVALFSAALELPASQRGAYLDEACADDPALRQRLEELLRVHQDAITFLEHKTPGAPEAPPGAAVPQATMRLFDSPSEKAGDRIGRYKLLQQIGEGGCGLVYMAEQEEPVRRRVALKVIKLGMDTKQVIARFEAERQALALMDHPNIAKVLDAGATDTGRPYFVMELVRGIKITDYCDENKLSTEERLKLFTQVCHAVQHAHQKGIIHRDIKPSNILVTINEPGAPGCPKIIDFGIAKATTGQKLTDKTLFTAFEQFMGTPAYMSPEQAMMTALDIDTRTDIYSLGVLLYELLTGKTPLDQKELLAAGLEEMRRTIREKEPLRPSTRLSTMLEGELTTTAKHRHTDPPKLIHAVRGDLDWIVMRCLEKDRARRYETANGLANDVLRHLNCEPVVARPPSRLYEFQKTVRRHKFGFAAAAALITVLAVGVVVSTFEAIRAQTEAAKATAISDFMQEMLRSANPEALKGSDYTVRQLLDDYSSRLDNQLKDQPGVEAEIRATLGRAYWRLGQMDKAQPQMERALTLRRNLGDSEKIAATLVDYAWTSYEQGQFAKGEAQAREALDIYRKRGTTGQPVISALRVLQRNLLSANRAADAEAVTEAASDIARKTAGVGFPELACMIHDLAGLRNGQSRYAEAEVLAQKAVAMHRRLRREGDIETAWALGILGDAQRGQHKLAEAEAAYREALAIFRKQYSQGHKSVDMTVSNLRAVLEARGDSAAIAALAQDQLAEATKRIARNEAVAQTWLQLCLIDADRKEWKAAAQHYEAALALCKDQGAAARKEVGQACLEIAGRANSAGQHEFAERVDRQALALFKQLALEDSRDSSVREDLANSLHSLTDIFFSQGKWADAEEASREAIPLFKQLAQDAPTHDGYVGSLGHSEEQLASVLLRTGRHDQAEPVLREALKVFERGTRDFPTLPYFPREQAFSRQLLGDAMNQLGRVDEAVASHREAIALLKQLAQADPKRSDYAIDSGHSYWRLGEVLLGAGRREQAEVLLRESLEVFEKAARDFPDSRPVRDELGLSRRRLGDGLSGPGQTEEAEQLYREALALYTSLAADAPQDSFYRVDRASTTWGLVNLLLLQGKLPEAEKVCRAGVEACEKANREFPDNTALRNEQAEGRRWLGTVLGRIGRVDEAEREYRTSIALYPWLKTAAPAYAFYRQQEAYATWMLAEMLEGANRLDAAEAEYRHAIALHEKASADFPDQTVFTERLSTLKKRLAELLHNQRRDAEAETLEREVADGGNLLVQNNIAWRWATDPDVKLRNGSNAVVYAEKVVSATSRTNAMYLDTLAAAYAEVAQFTNAVRAQQEAIVLSQTEQERNDYASRLKLYALAAPYRDDEVLATRTMTLLDAGKFVEAEPLARDCLTLREKQIPDDWRAYNARSMLGGALLGQKKYGKETEAMLLAGYKGMKQREATIPPDGRPRLKEALQRLAQFYEEQKLAEFDQAGKQTTGP